jgi:hypothetical protein
MSQFQWPARRRVVQKDHVRLSHRAKRGVGQLVSNGAPKVLGPITESCGLSDAMAHQIDEIKALSCLAAGEGGGTPGPIAALKAKLRNPKATVILLEKPM